MTTLTEGAAEEVLGTLGVVPAGASWPASYHQYVHGLLTWSQFLSFVEFYFWGVCVCEDNFQELGPSFYCEFVSSRSSGLHAQGVYPLAHPTSPYSPFLEGRGALSQISDDTFTLLLKSFFYGSANHHDHLFPHGWEQYFQYTSATMSRCSSL